MVALYDLNLTRHYRWKGRGCEDYQQGLMKEI